MAANIKINPLAVFFISVEHEGKRVTLTCERESWQLTGYMESKDERSGLVIERTLREMVRQSNGLHLRMTEEDLDALIDEDVRTQFDYIVLLKCNIKWVFSDNAPKMKAKAMEWSRPNHFVTATGLVPLKIAQDHLAYYKALAKAFDQFCSGLQKLKSDYILEVDPDYNPPPSTLSKILGLHR